MLLTPHILTGVAIITREQNPILGLIFVLLSHYLLDLLPHAEYSIKNIRSKQWSKSLPDLLRASGDLALGLSIVFLTTGFTPLILLAAFTAVLPDGLTLICYVFPVNGLLEKHFKIHLAMNNIYENKKIPAFWGFVSQVVVIVIAIYFLL